VIEVAFLGWTRHALIRQGRFLGLRGDKPAHAVRKE
jgi:ATP-dependent DNA ligase